MAGSKKISLAGLCGATWGVTGFAWILLDAINRLSGIALHLFDRGLTLPQWFALLATVIFMAYAEGYRGFQKSFSPRTAARAYYIYRNPDWLSVVLAPLFCMGFFRATRGPLLFAWVGTLLILLLVLLLQASPQPWRGIVDAGVVAGLSWGLVSFLLCVWRIFRTGSCPVSAEVPAEQPGNGASDCIPRV